jgi:hypothetical protein
METISRCAAAVVDAIDAFVEHSTVLANAGIEANMHGDDTTAWALLRAAEAERSTIIDALIAGLPAEKRDAVDDHLLEVFATLTPAMELLGGLLEDDEVVS